LKGYLRRNVGERIRMLDENHLDEIVDQWFEDETQRRLATAVERMG
jgi:hypothetical protein